MATLQSIRSKGPLLLIVIGLAMLAFILGDAWKIIRPNQGVQYVGEISGEDITAMDFQKELEIYTDVIKFANQIQNITDEEQNALKDEVWATMVRNRIIESEANAIGLTVTDAELRDVIERGSDPILARTPFNGEDGKFDSDILKRVLAFYSELDPQSVAPEEYAYYQSLYNYWLFIEKDIRSGLLYSKYNALVKASIVSNPIAAKNSFENRIKRADVLLAALPYSSVNDADVQVSSSDLKSVYNDLKPALYNYSETRDIVYIDYLITPSQADRQAQLEEMNEVVTQLESDMDDYSSFVRRSGSDIAYSEVARSSKNLPGDVAIRIDSVKVGGVFGPYYNEDDDTYNAFKLLGTSTGYDSIQVSVMQIIADDDEAVAQRADSIYNAIRKGADFEEIAANYGQTAVQQWLAANSYEPAVISGDNAVYLNKLNSMKKGEVAVIKLSDVTIVAKVFDTRIPVTKYNLAIVKNPIDFSEATSNEAYNKLSAFLSINTTIEQIRENIGESGFVLLNYPEFQSYSHNVAGVDKSSEALRWAFQAQEGEVSRIYEVGAANDHLLAVGVEKIHPRGVRSLEDAVPVLSLRAINDKKFDMLKGQLAGKSFNELKSIEGISIDTVKFVNFNNDAFVSSLIGNEAIAGPSVFNLGQNDLTVPMKGSNCAFVAQKISDDSYSAEFDDKTEQLRVRTISSSNIMNALIQALYYEAKVVDNRYTVF